MLSLVNTIRVVVGLLIILGIIFTIIGARYSYLSYKAKTTDESKKNYALALRCMIAQIVMIVVTSIVLGVSHYNNIDIRN
jgi:uncharacterized membrane protein YidH (DUF202 family)